MNVKILPSANADLINGYDFYEKQRDDLGRFFLRSLYVDIDKLSTFAGIHAKRFGMHYMVATRFPYTIYYKIESGVARIYAVAPDRQDPELISDRLT